MTPSYFSWWFLFCLLPMQTQAFGVLSKSPVLSNTFLFGASSSSTSATETKTEATTTIDLQETFSAVLDGPEWATLAPNGDTKAVRLSICIGLNPNGERVVALQQPEAGSKSNINNNNNVAALVYTESMARIPDSVANAVAAQTLHQAWASVHAVLPATHSQNIGGDPTATFTPWNVVILGSNPHAVLAAQALQSLKCQVTIVTTNTNDVPKKAKISSVLNAKTTEFASHLKTFDAVLDTVGNEFEHTSGFAVPSPKSVLSLLQSQHQCHVYMSTQTHQDEIISQAGLLFGPNQAKEYVQNIKCPPLRQEQLPASMSHLGQTVERLLQAGIVWPADKNKNDLVRGWTLKGYWESTTWRRSAEQPSVRFGWPVVADKEEEPLLQLEPPPQRPDALDAYFQQRAAEADKAEESSPYILRVAGVRGLEERVVKDGMDGVLFLSAPFCRTCRYLQPRYNRLARRGSESGITFAKADATGEEGKALGRHLGVDSIPTFVLFRQGQVYGTPLSISRLPSPVLDRAIQALQDGQEWNGKAVWGNDDNGEEGNHQRKTTRIF